MTPDLAALARAGRTAKPSELRGLGDAWRAAESALLADVAAAPRRARRIATAFERLAAACGEDEAVGRAARLRGSAMSHAGAYADCIAPYRRAIERLRGAARDGARVGLSLAYTRLGRKALAVRESRRARADAEARGDGLLAAAARMNEAVAFHEAGDPAAAEPLYRAARDGFAGANQPRHAARAADALANALVALDRFAEALPLYDEAAATLENSGLAREAAVCRYNRGTLLVAVDRLGEADAELETAERALRACGDAPSAALARLDRGEALLRAHLVPEAVRLVRTAVRAAEGRVPPADVARGAHLLARAEIAAGDPRAARRVLARGAGLSTARIRAERLEISARALIADGRVLDAQRTLLRALRTTRMPSERVRRLASVAWCLAETGDVAAARRHAAEAERLSATLPVPSLRFAASAARFVAEQEAGEDDAASRALARAFDALESLRAGLGPDAMRAALLHGSEAWFARAVRHTLAASGPRAALALLERWRARALVDLLGDAERAAAADRAMEALRAKLAVLERRLGGEGLPALLRSQTVTPEPRLVREVAATERALREAARRTRAAPVAPPADLGAFAASLPDGVVVLSLFADSVEGMAFVLDGTGVRVRRGLARDDEIAAAVEELHFRFAKFALGRDYVERHARRLAAETDEALARLATATLAPLADDLRRARRVIVVPHGAWHRVPFAALPFDGAPLGERIPVSLAPSVAALDNPHGRAARAATGRAIVVAVPDPLVPTIADEGRRVAAALDGATLLEGDAATSDALVTALRAGAPSVLHVAAHGRFRGDAPAMSGVRLADGWLRACELPQLGLDGSLVVLSGCDTGTSRLEGAGEALGLVRGALAAGARELVVSLWRVDDASTTDLMTRFHAGRSRGMPSDLALAAAQKSLRENGLHPWNWAGFACWTRSVSPSTRAGF